MTEFSIFIDGAIMLAFCAAGLFFLRFWTSTRDRLFLLFSIAFAAMAINRLFLTFLASGMDPRSEHHALMYLIRLIAFVIILIAIIDKNLRIKRSMPKA